MHCLKRELAANSSFSCILCREKVSEWLSEWVNEPGSLPLPQSAPVSQLLPLHPSQSLTSGSCSCCQSLLFPRLMVRYSWWRQSLGVIYMAPNYTLGIFDPWYCTGTIWVRDKALLNTSLHSPHICDIQATEISIRLLRSSCLSMYMLMLVRSHNRISGLCSGLCLIW